MPFQHQRKIRRKWHLTAFCHKKIKSFALFKSVLNNDAPLSTTPIFQNSLQVRLRAVLTELYRWLFTGSADYQIGLQQLQIAVQTTLDFHKFHVGAKFYNPALIEHQNFICIANSTQTVCDDDTGPADHQLI